MLQDRVSNQGPLTYESGALPIALRSPALAEKVVKSILLFIALAAIMFNVAESFEQFW